MDLPGVERCTTARSRADLAALADPAGRTAVLAGGTWLFSRPAPDLRALVDVTTLGWPPVTVRTDGLEIAATCTIAELRAADVPAAWTAWPLVDRCVDAFASSAKIWSVATVGGNVCLGLPAGPMTSLLAGLDATALVWRGDGTDREVPVVRLVRGVGEVALRPDEVVRSFTVPSAAWTSPVAFRRLAVTAHGRSGVIVVGRRVAGRLLLTLTAGTTRPVRLGILAPGPAVTRAQLRADVAAAVGGVDCWHDDHHGTAAWRRAMSERLALEVAEELTAGGAG